MTDDDLLHHLRENTPLNRVRAVLSGIIGEGAQQSAQRGAPAPTKWRKWEFVAVDRLLDAAEQAGLIRRLPAEQPDWWPQPTDANWCQSLRDDCPEFADLPDELIRGMFADNREYKVTWDRLRDAYEQWRLMSNWMLGGT